jgi:methylenetetrahydrofolate dehydrogenase (NADP+) / methenyltetrahydrofolate cyclohydrolase
MILDGKLASSAILNSIRDKIDNNVNLLKIERPSIAIILVGENPASESYITAKVKACYAIGIPAQVFRYKSEITTEFLIQQVRKFNQSKFTGFIVQLPLPEHIDKMSVINEISPEKDIDGFHPVNFGKMALGQKSMRPATAYGIVKLIEHYDIDTLGKHVVVVGRSNIVGKPISIMLSNDFNIGRATVTTCDINTPSHLLEQQCKLADILIVAVGKPNLIIPNMIKVGAVVIDVGINRTDNGKLVGDCDFTGISQIASMITPVPGGVGPMTIAGLVLNTFNAWVDFWNISQ